MTNRQGRRRRHKRHKARTRNRKRGLAWFNPGLNAQGRQKWAREMTDYLRVEIQRLYSMLVETA